MCNTRRKTKFEYFIAEAFVTVANGYTGQLKNELYTMKKIYLILLLAFAFVSAQADSFTIGEISYFIEDDIQVTATALGTSPQGEVTIPSYVSHNGKSYMVTKVGLGSWEEVTKLNLPRTLVTIGSHAFYGAEKLTSVNWADLIALQTIEDRAFVYTAIKEVTIPANVRTIEEVALSGCDELTKLTINSPLLEEIPYGCFSSPKLTEVTLSPNIKKIGSRAFNVCTSLKSIELPFWLQEIGEYAFTCTGLTELTIPMNVTTLGDGFLSWCTDLRTLKVQSYSPLTATSATFNGIDKDNVTLVVPKGTVSLYQQAAGWKEFKHITDGAQAIELVGHSSAGQKILRNGHVLIQSGDKNFTLTGQEIK